MAVDTEIDPEDLDTDVDDDVDPDDEPEAEPEYVAPGKDEWARTQAALKKANAEAKKHRLDAKALRAATESAAEKATREAGEANDAAGRYKGLVVRSAARAALATAGVKGTPDRALKLLDITDLEIDEDGDVVGLDEQVRALKKDWPDLFAGKGSSRVDAGNPGGGGGGSTKTATDIAIERLRGR
jgi:hypothetical protein